MKRAEIIIIRHAETEDNVLIEQSCDLFISLRQGRIPSAASFRALSSALTLPITVVSELLGLSPIDSTPIAQYGSGESSVPGHMTGPKLSQRGREQITDMQNRMRSSKFFDNYPNDILFYSPLLRCVETYKSLIPNATHDSQSLSGNNHHMLESLREASVLEHIIPSMMIPRTQRFEYALQEFILAKHDKQMRQTTDNSRDTDNTEEDKPLRILIIGHCKYFNFLLKQRFYMQNCDIWKVAYSFDSSLPNDQKIVSRQPMTLPEYAGGFSLYPAQWGEAELLLRSSKSIRHPIDTLFSWKFWKTGKIEGNGVSNCHITSDETNSASNDEPFCRICHETQSERPNVRLIKPCLCSGTNAYVHADCLTHWRSTSADAYEKCITCKYIYRTKTHPMLKFIMNNTWTSYILAFLLSIVLIVFSGFILITFFSNYTIPVQLQDDKRTYDVNVFDAVLYFFAEDDPPEGRVCVKYTQKVRQIFQFWRNLTLGRTQHGHRYGFIEFLYPFWKVFQCSSYYRLILSGFILVGGLAQTYYYLQLLLSFIQWHRGGGEGRRLQLPTIFSIWVIGVDKQGTFRLFTCAGMVMFISMAGQWIIERIRKVSSKAELEELP